MGRRRHERGRASARPNAAAPARGWWILPLFLCLVLAVKAVVLGELQDHPLIQPDGGVDAAAYVRLAREVLAGNVALGPGLYYLSPLYIYFLAAGLGLSDSFTAVRAAQIVLGTAAVWCVFLAARLWFGRRAAWIAAALAAATGVFTFYEILIMQASLDTFLTAAALACLAHALMLPPEGGSHRTAEVPPEGGSYTSALVVSAFRRKLKRKDLWAGVLFGLQTLNRPNVAIAAAGVVLTMAIARRWRGAAWMLAGMALAISPVVARNAIVSHQFAWSSSHGGLNLYIGNNAAATGQYVSVPDVRSNVEGQSEDTRKVAEAALGHPLTDAQVSRYFADRALDWARANPARAAALFARKLALVFNARHQWLDFSYPYYAYDTGSILRFLFVGPWLLVPLGFFGAALLLTGSPGSSGSSGSPGAGFSGFAGSGFSGFAGSAFSGFAERWVWISFVPFYAIGVAVFFVAERYRLPIFVPLCVCSGGGVDRLLQAFPTRPSDIGHRTSTWRATDSAAIAVALCGALLTAWPFPLNNGRYDERLALSKALMNRHDYGAAAVELQQALDLQPDNTVTEFNLGIALVSAGRPTEGLPHMRHAVDAKVPIPGARYVAANAMLTTGDREGAVLLLRTFYPEESETAESCFQVGMLALRAGAPRVAARYLQRALELKPGWPDALQALQQVGG